ncbi:MAG: helix-turn-helix domain-containing protein [Balneolaceae bacterium]
MTAPNKKPMGIAEAAEFLMVSKSYLYSLTAKGSIKHYKPGKRIVFLESDLVEFLEENMVDRVNSNEPAPQHIRSEAAKRTMGPIK